MPRILYAWHTDAAMCKKFLSTYKNLHALPYPMQAKKTPQYPSITCLHTSFSISII